jgi:hypothetical protein
VAVEPLRLLTRRHCHLCELVRAPLSHLAAELSQPLEEFDIDEYPDLALTYTERVPVLLWGQKVLAEGRFDPEAAVRAWKLSRVIPDVG